MVKPWFKIGILILLALALGLVYARCSNRDARLIHRQWDRLVGSVEKRPEEPPLQSLGRANAIPDFFAREFHVSLRPVLPNMKSRNELLSTFSYVRGAVTSLSLGTSDRTLTVNRSAGTAFMTATIRGTVVYGTTRETHAYEFDVDWIKEDGTWRIQTLTLVQSIEAPPVL